MKDKLANYFKKRVEIKAKGVTYRGYLSGADEDTVYLKMETGWITIAMEEVSAIRGREDKDWEIKEVPGEPAKGPDRKKRKKPYSSRDLDEIHAGDRKREWPEWEDEDE
jgi:hypothetical protein